MKYLVFLFLMIANQVFGQTQFGVEAGVSYLPYTWDVYQIAKDKARPQQNSMQLALFAQSKISEHFDLKSRISYSKRPEIQIWDVGDVRSRQYHSADLGLDLSVRYHWDEFRFGLGPTVTRYLGNYELLNYWEWSYENTDVIKWRYSLHASAGLEFKYFSLNFLYLHMLNRPDEDLFYATNRRYDFTISLPLTSYF